MTFRPNLNSLTTRIILLGVLFVIIGALGRLLFLTDYLREDLTELTAAQLSAMANYVAQDVDRDIVARRDFLEDLRDVARAGVTLILVTHHVEEVLPEISRLVLLRGGRVLRDGARDALLTGEVLTEVFGREMRVERRGDWDWARIA